MFLMCLGHERIIFGIFLTCFKPRNAVTSYILAVLADFQYKFVKIDFFRLKNGSQTNVIHNTLLTEWTKPRKIESLTFAGL